MKRWIILFFLSFGMIAAVPGTAAVSCGETVPSFPLETGEELPVYGNELKDGTYPIKTDSSSSMFRIVKADLTVKEGKITAVLTLGGKGYLKLFMGTGKEAEQAGEDQWSDFDEDEEGAYTYTVPVAALNTKLECTGFSKRKEKWYDHQIIFRAETLPKEAFLTEPIKKEQEEIDVDDGTYQIDVTLSGGSGRASVHSPAVLIVEKKKAVALIEWSSPYYDYMVVDGQKFLPVNQEEYSVFEIPVTAFDQEIPVTADTTAMGNPHEVEYCLFFHRSSVEKPKNSVGRYGIPAAGIMILIFAGAKIAYWRIRMVNHDNQ